jgi:hypothetical protein
MKRLSKVLKVKEVQSIKFEKYAKRIQAILINPKWRVSSQQSGFCDLEDMN